MKIPIGKTFWLGLLVAIVATLGYLESASLGELANAIIGGLAAGFRALLAYLQARRDGAKPKVRGGGAALLAFALLTLTAGAGCTTTCATGRIQIKPAADGSPRPAARVLFLCDGKVDVQRDVKVLEDKRCP